jgi:bifunctional non-homologous end joining protein LigD
VDRLAPYRGKRSAGKTPEPVPEAGPLPAGRDDTFVIQEHHARRLHWDFRLERGGVLVSWALPKGLPDDPKRNHLAVQTEDHPLEYASFEGKIPGAQYGAGTVSIWDSGRYECETWTDREVKVTLHGSRSQGRFALIHTDARNWLIHRMTPIPAAAGQPTPAPFPELIAPMLAAPGPLPTEDTQFAYEPKWDGVRAVAYIRDNRLLLRTRNGADVTAGYPELAGLADALGGVPAVLDGEIVAYDAAGRVSFGALQPRMHLQDPDQVARLASESPVRYQIFDLMFLDGHSTMDLPYEQRRELLAALNLDGEHWQTSPFVIGGGAQALADARRDRTEGIVAKRLGSPYLPDRRSGGWVKIKNFRTQEVVIGGWREGQGNRAGTIGSLLLGIPAESGLDYVGQVGTGFTRETLSGLLESLTGLARKTSPFAEALPTRDAKDAHWVTPRLVGEVAFAEWTRDGRLRHPSWRGLRPDKSAADVAPEPAG